MLERATGCLEHGTRRVLFSSRKSIRSQRSLHSTFFCHGAGDIDLPSWWIELLQRPPLDKVTIAQSIADTAKKCISAGLSDGSFLDFLYPAKTLSLIHKLAIRDAQYVRNRNSIQTNHNVARSYTSEASETRLAVESDRDHAMDLLDVVQHNATEPLAPIIRLSARRKKLDPKIELRSQRVSYERAWEVHLRKVRLTPDIGNLKVKRENMQRLSHDLQYVYQAGLKLGESFARYLLEHLPSIEWQAHEYDSAVRAALFLNNDDRALYFYKNALKVNQGAPATTTVLELSITNESWIFLAEALNAYTAIRGEETDFWRSLKNLKPKYLVQKGLSLFRYIKRNKNIRPDLRLRDIAGKMLEQILNMRVVENIDLKYYSHIWSILNRCIFPTEWHYNTALKRLLSQSGDKFVIGPFTAQALQIWSPMCGDDSKRVQRDVLSSLFKRCCHLHRPEAREVFEDWRARFGIPPPVLFHYVIREMFHQGDVRAFKQYLEQLIASHGIVNHLSYLVRLIRLHGRRGEVSEAVKVFESAQSQHGLSHTVSSWNAIMEAHSKVGDVEGVVQWHEKMIESGISPEFSTLAQLLRTWASQGDIRAVEKVSSEILAGGTPLNATMIDSLAYAYVQNEDLDAAKRIVIGALEMDFEGSRTNMWNTLINAFALRRDLEEVFGLHQRMVQAGVPEDAMTCAALMQAFSSVGYYHSALSIIRKVMPSKKLLATSFHYSIVMAGLLRAEAYTEVFSVYQMMIRSGITPDFGVKTLLIKAAAQVDLVSQRDSKNLNGEARKQTRDLVLARAEELLDRLLESADPKDLSQQRPILDLGRQPLNEAYSANYFEYLIVLYGRAGAFNKVVELYERYTSFAQSYAATSAISPPLKMLSALMLSYHNQRQFEEVERCWQLAFSKAEPLARRKGTDTSTAKWVLQSRRHLLCAPLFWYMHSLADSGRTSDIDPVLDSLHYAGYALDNKCWNYYVEAVALSGRTSHAFRTAENQLMGGWDGWPPASPRSPKNTKIRLLEKQRRLVRPQDRLPFYRTLVILAGAYMDMRAKLAFAGIEREEKVMELERIAPRALNAVQTMRKFNNDAEQKKYLKPYLKE